MSPRTPLALFCLVLSSLALVASSPVYGLPEKEDVHVEGFIGYNTFDSVIDFDMPFSFGSRAGVRSKRFGVEATASRFESDFELGTSTTGEQEIIALDLSANLYLNPWSAWEWTLFAGPGWRYVDVVNRSRNGRAASAEGDDLSVHIGAAVRITVGERLYVRPDLRIRSTVDGDISGDIEASLALGYSFF